MTPSLSIPMSELQFRFTPSGGPGGQHANKVNTRVELRFDVAGSPSLGPRQRARLLERLGPELRVVADDERSQLRNRQLAVERFRHRMAAALHIDKPRRPTRPEQGGQGAASDRQTPPLRAQASRGGRTLDRVEPVQPTWRSPTSDRGRGQAASRNRAISSVSRSGRTRSSSTELACTNRPVGQAPGQLLGVVEGVDPVDLVADDQGRDVDGGPLVRRSG